MGDEYVRDELWTMGPWTAHTFMVKAGHDKICQTGYSSSLGPHRSHEAEANARLIATAPTFADIAARAQYMANQRGGDYGDLTKDELCALMVEYDNALSAARVTAPNPAFDALMEGEIDDEDLG